MRAPARNLEQLQNHLSISSYILNFDLKDYNNLKSNLSQLPEEFSEIDILINNAGIALGLDRAYEASFEDWDCMVDTNIKGVMALTHAILPQMVKRDKGHVVNTSSVAAVNPYVGGNVYGATKAFVHHFSSNLRNDLLGTHVRVTTIAPGLTKTELFDVRFKGNKERVKAIFEGIKVLDAKDIAEAIFWATEQPPHVNINMIELMPLCQAQGNTSPKRNI